MKNFICGCCGQEFYSEYYTGGYIDHTNLCRNRHVYKFRLKDGYIRKDDEDKSEEHNHKLMIEDVVESITYEGNRTRSKDDILKRLACFKSWDEFTNVEKIEVEQMALSLIEWKEKTINKLENILNSLTYEEIKELETLQFNLYPKK